MTTKLDFIETPEISGNNDIINKGELHLPAVILVDTSASVRPHEVDLNKAMQLLVDTIKKDKMASGRVELMFIALCVAAVGIALLFARASRKHPELALDAPNKA